MPIPTGFTQGWCRVVGADTIRPELMRVLWQGHKISTDFAVGECPGIVSYGFYPRWDTILLPRDVIEVFHVFLHGGEPVLLHRGTDGDGGTRHTLVAQGVLGVVKQQ